MALLRHMMRQLLTRPLPSAHPPSPAPIIRQCRPYLSVPPPPLAPPSAPPVNPSWVLLSGSCKAAGKWTAAAALDNP